MANRRDRLFQTEVALPYFEKKHTDIVFFVPWSCSLHNIYQSDDNKTIMLFKGKVGYCDETIFQIFQVLFLPFGWTQNNRKSGPTNKTLWQKQMNRKRVLSKSVPKQNFSTAAILSAGTVDVQHRGLYTTYIICNKKFRQRKCDKGEMVEDTVCCLEELEAVCFWHSCHRPFEKCIKAWAELAGLGLGTQSRDHHPNPHWWRGAGASCCCCCCS